MTLSVVTDENLHLGHHERPKRGRLKVLRWTDGYPLDEDFNISPLTCNGEVTNLN